MTQSYFRPIASTDAARPSDALPLAGGWAWWSTAELLSRTAAPQIIAARDVPPEVRDRISASRADVSGLSLDQPRLMGILNTTPDSFSDGGQHNDLESAVAHAHAMAQAGAEIIDIGGESTRPGAEVVTNSEEVSRTQPVIEALRAANVFTPVSIDTRKGVVAQAAVSAGANIINDVSGLSYDPELINVVAETGLPVCIMHAQGDPKTMQKDPTYENVLLDVYDYLHARIEIAKEAGIPRSRIIVDPGIGFGKTVAHNMALIRGLSLFHALGCPILLGVSRKRFIGVIGNAQDAATRGPGSIALGLEALRQGVQFLRVHDVADTRQAMALWWAAHGGSNE